jgi:hypothetical protein
MKLRRGLSKEKSRAPWQANAAKGFRMSKVLVFPDRRQRRACAVCRKRLDDAPPAQRYCGGCLAFDRLARLLPQLLDDLKAGRR